MYITSVSSSMVSPLLHFSPWMLLFFQCPPSGLTKKLAAWPTLLFCLSQCPLPYLLLSDQFLHKPPFVFVHVPPLSQSLKVSLSCFPQLSTCLFSYLDCHLYLSWPPPFECSFTSFLFPSQLPSMQTFQTPSTHLSFSLLPASFSSFSSQSKDSSCTACWYSSQSCLPSIFHFTYTTLLFSAFECLTTHQIRLWSVPNSTALYYHPACAHLPLLILGCNQLPQTSSLYIPKSIFQYNSGSTFPLRC